MSRLNICHGVMSTWPSSWPPGATSLSLCSARICFFPYVTAFDVLLPIVHAITHCFMPALMDPYVELVRLLMLLSLCLCSVSSWLAWCPCWALYYSCTQRWTAELCIPDLTTDQPFQWSDSAYQGIALLAIMEKSQRCWDLDQLILAMYVAGVPKASLC